jgi:hypothetical protein
MIISAVPKCICDAQVALAVSQNAQQFCAKCDAKLIGKCSQ